MHGQEEEHDQQGAQKVEHQGAADAAFMRRR